MDEEAKNPAHHLRGGKQQGSNTEMWPEAVARVPTGALHPPPPAGLGGAFSGENSGVFWAQLRTLRGIDSSLLSFLRITAGIKFKQSDLARIRLALVTVYVKRLLKRLHLSGIGAFQPAGQEEARRKKRWEIRQAG